jgi:hypothetical protein
VLLIKIILCKSGNSSITSRICIVFKKLNTKNGNIVFKIETILGY